MTHVALCPRVVSMRGSSDRSTLRRLEGRKAGLLLRDLGRKR
jgi:hypothetical protein